MKNKLLVLLLVTTSLLGLMLGYALSFQTLAKDFLQEADSLRTQIYDLQSELSSVQQQLTTKILGIHFSPEGGCTDQVTYWIGRANVSIHVLIYSFTLDSIGDALIDAYERGVEVRIVFEKSQISEYSEYGRLKAAGIMVRNDTNPDLMHDKVMIVDGVIVLTGSFNWSNNAEKNNNENLIIINSTYVARIYEEEFEEIWNKSI